MELVPQQMTQKVPRHLRDHPSRKTKTVFANKRSILRLVACELT